MEKRPPPSPLVSSPYSKRAEIRDRWVAFCPSSPRASFSLANIIRVQRTKERPGPRNRAMWLPFGEIFFFSLSKEEFLDVSSTRSYRCRRKIFLSTRLENSSAKDFEEEESREMKERIWGFVDLKIILEIFRISRIWVCLRVVSMRFLRARRIDGDGPRRELVSTIPFPRWIFIRVYTGLIRGFVAS